MRTSIAIIAAATAALASTIGMASDGKQRFVHDGSTYVYTSRQVADRQVIDGHRFPEGAAFHLVVRSGRVTGTSGGIPVAFDVAKGGNPVETAAR